MVLSEGSNPWAVDESDLGRRVRPAEYPKLHVKVLFVRVVEPAKSHYQGRRAPESLVTTLRLSARASTLVMPALC
jgi:hypothetical protein